MHGLTFQVLTFAYKYLFCIFYKRYMALHKNTFYIQSSFTCTTQTVVGGVQDCNDFGFNLNSGTFRGFLKLSKECTRDLDAGKPHITIGQWYMIAVTNNATHMVIYQNGEYKDSNTVG